MERHQVLPNLIATVADSDPERVLIEHIGGRAYSYGEFHATATQWAGSLAAVGVEQNDRVATMLPTSPDAYHCWIGLGYLRAPEVPVNPEFRGSILSYTLNNCGAQVLVASSRFVQQLLDVADELVSLKTVVVPDAAGDLPGMPWRVVAGGEFFTEARRDCLRVPAYYDVNSVIYTSGTTGPSKGVLQPWANIQNSPACMFPGDDPARYDDGAVFTAWPMFHSSGRAGLCVAAQLGLRMVLRDKFSLGTFWDEIRAYRCTHAALLVVGGLLMRQPARPDERDNPLVRVGMFPLIAQYREFEQRFGVRVSSAFGSTEVGWVVATDDPINHRVAGKPISGYQVRIVNEVDEPVGPDTFGEIVVRHDLPWQLNSGYLNQPQATADAWRNGWWHTGDGGLFDADGNLYFVDRLKDYLRHRGHNVSSFEVEAEVLTHPDVLECACVGVPSDLANEDDVIPDDDIKVFVVKEVDASLSAAQLHAALASRMPAFMVPRYIEFVDSLPRTPSQKVRKVELRARPAVGEQTWDSKQSVGATRA